MLKLNQLGAFFLIIAFLAVLSDYYIGGRAFNSMRFLNFIGYFLLGYALPQLKFFQVKRPMFYGGLYFFSSLAIAILTYLTVRFTLYDLYFYSHFSPFTILGTLSLYLLFNSLNIKENLLSRMAPYSFGIYLIHAFFLDVFHYSFGYMPLRNPIIDIPLTAILVFIISAAVSFLFYKNKKLKKLI